MNSGQIVVTVIGTVVVLFILLMVLDIVLYGCGYNVQCFTQPHLYRDEIKTKDIGKTLPIDRKSLETKKKQGLDKIKDKKIIIAALARNVEKTFPNSTNKAEMLGRGFKDYRIVIFENDSNDNTRNRIKEWSLSNPKVSLMTCCDDGDCDCRLNVSHPKTTGAMSQSRIEKMAKFRNRYLQYVKENYPTYDYLLVYDFDIRGGIYIDGYHATFSDEWDAVFARGIKPLPIMFGSVSIVYDVIAFVEKGGSPIVKKQLLSHFFKLQNLCNNKKIGSQPIPVGSGFNGMAIYRMGAILPPNVVYDHNTICEHVDFHQNIDSDRKYISPSLVLNIGLDNETEMPFKTFIGWFKKN